MKAMLLESRFHSCSSWEKMSDYGGKKFTQLWKINQKRALYLKYVGKNQYRCAASVDQMHRYYEEITRATKKKDVIGLHPHNATYHYINEHCVKCGDQLSEIRYADLKASELINAKRKTVMARQLTGVGSEMPLLVRVTSFVDRRLKLKAH